MSVTPETVDAIARLARLEFSESEKSSFLEQFNRVLEYIGKLNEVDVEGVEPMTHVMDTTNVLREDEVLPCLPVEEVLKNAPSRLENFIKVPKVVE
jgi:aspartyl-tRNA(Asn)/glutamyl-tRNA(Gln) amidotransferase subunit C